MTPQETAQSYDNLASHWISKKFNRGNGIKQHQRALMFSKNRESAIDIGCGSSGRIIELLLAEGFEVEGLDISPEMLRLAKEMHSAQTFHLADICEWDFPKQYDFISAWDSIWHAPLEQHEPILKKLCEGLKNEGILIFTSGGLDEPGDGSNPFLGQPLYHASLGIPKLLEVVSEKQCICRHLEYDQKQAGEGHIYLIVQKVEPVVVRQ
jgi:SAM-dependent methyltransferase